MNNEEKVNWFENLLAQPKNSLAFTSPLEHLVNWDSLTMLNLQIELMMVREDVTLDDIRGCKTVGDLCGLLP